MKRASWPYKILFCALLLGLYAGQVEAQDSIEYAKKLILYQSQNWTEKIFIHTDRELYLSGETIGLRIFSMSAWDNKPLYKSHVVYVEILNADQLPILQTKIQFDRGKEDGSLTLPENMVSGNYTLRAYTHRMKNFDPQYYFTKFLKIINISLPPFYPKKENKLQYTLNLFPEGGNLVKGIPSKIAFKVNDQYGRGWDGIGELENRKTGKVIKIHCFHLGMGILDYTPQTGDDFRFRFPIADTILSQKIPTALDEGFTLNLDQKDSVINVQIRSSPRFLQTKVFLLIHNQNSIKKALILSLNNGEANVTIPKSSLGEGISCFTLFNTLRQPVSERLFFTVPENTLRIQLQIDHPIIPSRSLLRGNIHVQDKNGNPLRANLSLSGFLLDSLQNNRYEDINTFIFLRSELRGYIENPEYYFNTENAESQQAANILMMTQGWRRFKWEEMGNEESTFPYFTEEEGFMVHGKITNKKTGLPQSGVLCTVSNPGVQFDLAPSLSGHNGELNFNLKSFWGHRDLILQTSNPADSDYRIDLENPFSEKFIPGLLPRLHLKSSYKTALINRSMNAQIQKIYFKPQFQESFHWVGIDSSRFYGIPDRNYKLDDFKRFTNMEEVIREFILDVHLKKVNDTFHFRISNTPMRYFFEDDPLILLDGLFIRDATKLIRFDPLKIKNIEVVSHTYFLGSLLNEGIISFRTYKGDLGSFSLDPNALIVDFTGLEMKREFYSPSYTNPQIKAKRQPDFRNRLFWNPHILTDSLGNGKFQLYSPDNLGSFGFVIQGVTDNGLYGSASYGIEIKN